MSKNFFENFSMNNLKHNLYFVLCGLVLLTSQTPITKERVQPQDGQQGQAQPRRA